MIARRCALVGCRKEFRSSDGTEFCPDCRNKFSAKALTVMQYFGLPIGEAIVKAAKLFSSAQGIADYFGVSLPTLYGWIRQYHGLSFRQFKRKYVCPTKTCIVVDHAGHYSWKYTVADRVHERGGCICFIEGSDDLIMTTLSASTMSEILRAEVAADVDTGICNVRYPIRSVVLPVVVDDDEDDPPAASPKRKFLRAASRNR